MKLTIEPNVYLIKMDDESYGIIRKWAGGEKWQICWSVENKEKTERCWAKVKMYFDTLEDVRIWIEQNAERLRKGSFALDEFETEKMVTLKDI